MAESENEEKRPTLPNRHGQYMELSELNTLIATLDLAYEQDGNELVYNALTSLKDIKKKARANFFNLEEIYRDDEIREFFENPGKYPDSVRIWMLHYRNDEIS